jgi:hypothetical protein
LICLFLQGSTLYPKLENFTLNFEFCITLILKRPCEDDLQGRCF